ncbi:DUF3068 domain-containing protein [Nocardioides sp. cx-173]|uniref:DUF3068 domain-containing protein n=1 Tax=Nocardioides sp. cx-173 TaxID=2898796 RepID=UPI0022ABED04|nr:DUF3068 domain-containing protein [Nocardioides sp. cx-173]
MLSSSPANAGAARTTRFLVHCRGRTAWASAGPAAGSEVTRGLSHTPLPRVGRPDPPHPIKLKHVPIGCDLHYYAATACPWEGNAVRKFLAPILLGLGCLLLVVGLMCLAWAPGQVKKLPLDVVSVTNLSGTVSKQGAPESPVKVESITKVDSSASDDETAAWVNTSCVVIDRDDPPSCVDGDDERLVSASTDVFASDRVTALAVSDFEGLPEATEHEGLINKWPFGAEKKDYEYWDGTAGAAFPAVYDRTEDVEGVECYVYQVDISDEEIEVAEGVPGTYDQAVEIWVEPTTGAILQQTQDQQRFLEDGTQVLDLKIAFTEDQVKESSSDAKDNVARLNLITKTVPIVGLSAGAILILAGILLLLGARRGRGASAHTRSA